MSHTENPRHRTRLVVVLAIGQIVGWGACFDSLALLGNPIGRDLGLAKEFVFAGLTVMMAVSAFCGPTLGRALVRYGARPVLVAGSLLFTIGLAILALSSGIVSYAVGWLVMGFAGACGLTTAAHTAMVERIGAEGGRMISLLMIFTGLSGTVFLPITAYIEHHLGWRCTLAIFACLQFLIILPLYLLALPERQQQLSPKPPEGTVQLATVSASRRHAFLLLAAMTTISVFVSFGLSPLVPSLLLQVGASSALALQLASARGIFAICARGLDFLLGKRGNPFATGMVGSLLFLFSLLVLLGFGASTPVFVAFMLLFGFGGGVVAVSRAILPLAVFSPQEYGLQAARISLPQNLATAAAPLFFTTVLERGGATFALSLASALSVVSILLLALLWRTSRKSTQSQP
ncbi:MFS transporter [Agrobacterium tumefaciens]|uniref:MFS transporter n=1 Tax=Agrobacterium tumefaciens TaxID=358 RepID=UPI00287BF296|nr:MFS transporter [Agrobacterium tumefaciens]MDS7596545.1 MFS transporter [Agrobacterium tumefaciens]